MVIAWNVRGLFCAILCVTIVHSAMHTHMKRPNSSLDWVLSHWAHFTVLRFIFMVALCNRADHIYFHPVVTRRRSSSFAEYCRHFVARLNDVHAFGYNSAVSERIWMKFGERRDYCLELSWTNFGRDPRRSGSGRASRIFVFFCPLNDARFHRLPVSQISRNLHTKTCFCVLCWGFGKHL